MLDQTNVRLIEELQRDGRQSNRVLAKKLGVSEGTIRKRIKDLRTKDLLRVAAVPNLHNLGFDFICIMGFEVKLDELQRVSEQLARCPNVYFLTNVTGHFDMVAILLFRKAQELNDFVRNTISTMPAILRTETFVSMNILKSPWESAGSAVDLLALPG